MLWGLGARRYWVTDRDDNKSSCETSPKPTPVPKTKAAPQSKSCRLPYLASAKAAASASLITFTGS